MKRQWLIGFCMAINLLPLQTNAWVASKVILAGGPPELCQRIGTCLTQVLQEINKMEEGQGEYDILRTSCTDEGLCAVRELVEANCFYATRTEYRTALLELPNGQYEVRGVMVRVKMGTTKGNPLQELVFTLNREGRIVHLRYAMEQALYRNMIEAGRRLDDLAYREQILHFLEIFRTAYNKKDLAYIEKAYSDDALIIVGKVIRKAEKSFRHIGLENSTLGDQQIRLIKLSKRQYVEGLRKVFKVNAFVKVTFDSLSVLRHPNRPRIYGVTLKQRWNSSTYDDEGYLFLMIDFRDEAHPLIHVRSWQPDPFEDGTIVSLGDFPIID